MQPERIPLKDLKGQGDRPYIAEPALVHAANTALKLQMPLLLTGEPGCGKSDFSWVAAKALGHTEPWRFHVRSDTRARDLLYHYDALIRFGDMQHGEHERAKDPRNYVSLRPLGAALMSPDEKRRVVLIDEIDKAPRDLPNDLLHEIDEGWFEIPEIGDFDCTNPRPDPNDKHVHLVRRMQRPQGKPKPLVIITSNAERQLPEAFLRRCLFYHIPPPKENRLVEIALARFPSEPGDPSQKPLIIANLAKTFHRFRDSHGFAKRPTTAEMLNWIEALVHPLEVERISREIRPFTGEGRCPWGQLPELHCLLKMHEDLVMVGARDP